MAKKDDLQQKLTELGVAPSEFEGKTNPEMEAMIDKMTPSDLGEVIPAIEATPSMEELKAESDKIDSQIGKKDAQPKKLYDMEEVKKMFSELYKIEQSKKNAEDDSDDEDGPRKHTVRMARINNKFVVGFKNLNTDQYFPDRTIYSQDVFNEQNKQFVPHVTLLLESDGTETIETDTLTIPLETAFRIANKVVCEIAERKTVDASEKFGQIEVQEIQPDQYGMKGTGNFIQGKAKISKETYVVILPSGRKVEVIPGVVNW